MDNKGEKEGNPKAHPSLHSDSKRYGIKEHSICKKPTSIKEKAHSNFHADAKKDKNKARKKKWFSSVRPN